MFFKRKVIQKPFHCVEPAYLPTSAIFVCTLRSLPVDRALKQAHPHHQESPSRLKSQVIVTRHHESSNLLYSTWTTKDPIAVKKTILYSLSLLELSKLTCLVVDETKEKLCSFVPRIVYLGLGSLVLKIVLLEESKEGSQSW